MVLLIYQIVFYHQRVPLKLNYNFDPTTSFSMIFGIVRIMLS